MIYTIIIILFICSSAIANTESYYKRTKLGASDYLLGENAPKKDPIFEGQSRHVELGVDLAIGSDCGRVNFKSTLRATLKNLLDAQYFGDMGRDILAASPMLLTCYFSPTWCAILKHTRISANWLGKLRLDQCSLIDKYTDSRVEDFYVERQECVHKAIQRNGGNMEQAMKECGNSNTWQYDLSDWAGKRGKVSTNKLIQSSADWAGFKDQESSKTIELIKSMVGDTIISKGRISVDYGPRRIAITPRLHFRSLQKTTLNSLCKDLMKKVQRYQGRQDINQIVTNDDLSKISGGTNLLLDRQTIRSLSVMPYRQREVACTKLASAISLTRFTNQMNQSLDILEIAAQNPNLPEKRKREIQTKRKSLGESIHLTIELHRNKNEPLNQVLARINQEGSTLIDHATMKALNNESQKAFSKRTKLSLWDCADGIMCSSGGI